MSSKVIITIARQYGSGGREIGEEVARLLGIPLYDKEIITDTAAKGEIDEAVVINKDETAANSLLYTLAMGSNAVGTVAHFGYKMPINDKLFLLQSEIIKGYAEKGSCVVIGRCADYVLRDEPKLVRVFIYGNTENRIERVKAFRPEIKHSQIIDLIHKTDRRRSSYYNFYTGNKWGKLENYDLAINSSTLGMKGAAELIAKAAKKLSESD